MKVFLSTQSFLGPPLLLPGTDLLLVLPRPTAAFWVNFAPSLAMFDVAEFSETPFTARFSGMNALMPARSINGCEVFLPKRPIINKSTVLIKKPNPLHFKK